MSEIEGNSLVKNMIREMREFKPLIPTADIDVVWVLSGPGTYSNSSTGGIYKGRWPSADRERIDFGIEVVKRITAQRLKTMSEEKFLDDITKEDIGAFGPLFFYNGEDSGTTNTIYAQQEDLFEAARKEGFPLPLTKMVFGHIDYASTPSQVVGFAEFLRSQPELKKIAVVSHAGHGMRVGRYLSYYKELFPQDIELLNAAICEIHDPVGTILREVRKTVKYLEKGHLAPNPWPGF